VDEDVIHYAVPNMGGVVGRTATHALMGVAMPYIQLLARLGFEAAVASSPALAAGVCTQAGRLLHISMPEFPVESET
jgi:alanine dehydrogenase